MGLGAAGVPPVRAAARASFSPGRSCSFHALVTIDRVLGDVHPRTRLARRRQSVRFAAYAAAPKACAPMWARCGLGGRPAGSHRGSAVHFACGTAGHKSPAGLFGGTELTAGEGPGQGDGA